MSDETTPNDGSLDTAASRIMGLLFDSPQKESEDKSARESQPEQSPKAESAQATEQAPAAPETQESESEQAPSTEPAEEPGETPQPRTFKVKVDGQEVEVPEDELLKGYSRTSDYTRKTQELAAQRRDFEEKELSAVRAERHQYATTLGQMQQWLQATNPPEPSLATSASPEAFAIEWTQWKQHQDHIANVTAEQSRVQAKEADDADKGFRQYLQSEQAKLSDALPAFRDPETAVSLKRDLSDFAKSRGFTDEDLSKVTDHRLVVLLHDAMQGHKSATAAKAKEPEIKNKIENALATSQPGARTTTNPKSKFAEAKARLQKSGRPEDAGAAISELLGIK